MRDLIVKSAASHPFVGMMLILGTKTKASSKEAREEVNSLAQELLGIPYFQTIATELESAVEGSELDQ
jgi:hypothetical protein